MQPLHVFKNFIGHLPGQSSISFKHVIQPLSLVVFTLTALIINVASLQHQGLTYDEKSYYDYATKVLAGAPTRAFTENTKMPSSVLNVLGARAVLFYKGKLSPNTHLSDDQIIMLGRWVTILFWLLTAWVVYRWSKKLYGKAAGTLALFLYLFEPNILGHSNLVTTDLFAAFAMITSSYFFWRFLRKGGFVNGLQCAFVTGVGQLAKYTSLSLTVLFLIIAMANGIPFIYEKIRTRCWLSLGKGALKFFGFLFLFIVVNILVLNAGFGFHDTMKPVKEHHFLSLSFSKWQTETSLANMPIPVPAAYLQGLDLVKYCDETGLTYGNVYLLGQLHLKKETLEGFPGYYFYCLLFKVPLVNIFLLMVAMIFIVIRFRMQDFIRNELLLLLPAVFFLIYYNCFVHMQIGLRNILFLLPFMCILVSGVLRNWNGQGRRAKIAVFLLSGYYLISSLSYFPHFVSYVNELILDRKMSYKYFADSNLDMGGKEWYLNKYMKEHPEAILEPTKLVVGHAIINVNEFVGVLYPEKFRWVRENFTPVDHIAYSFIVVDITREGLLKAYMKWKKDHPSE